MNSCVFLDRDGTIIHDKGYLSDPGQIEITPGAVKALKLLAANGFLLVVISNQSGVGRGYFDVRQLEEMDRALKSRLAGKGAFLDGTYYCVHTDEDGCDCRKPGTALAERASRDLDIDTTCSYVIGDKACDVEMARRLGCRSILVSTGAGEDGAACEVEPDYRAEGLLEAARIIVADRGRRGRP